MGAQRRYSDDQRANALAALAANDGNVKGTARQISIPEKTLASWAKGERHPEAARSCDEKKEALADLFEGVLRGLLGDLADPAQRALATYKDKATAAGIATDKMCLLRGEATSIEEKRHDVSDRLTARIERLRAALAGGGGGAADGA